MWHILTVNLALIFGVWVLYGSSKRKRNKKTIIFLLKYMWHILTVNLALIFGVWVLTDAKWGRGNNPGNSHSTFQKVDPHKKKRLSFELNRYTGGIP